MTAHGLRSTYVNCRCRCDECRAAAAAYMRERRRAATWRSLCGEPSGVGVHGRWGYSNGCKCQVCRSAHIAYMASRRQVVVSDAG